MSEIRIFESWSFFGSPSNGQINYYYSTADPLAGATSPGCDVLGLEWGEPPPLIARVRFGPRLGGKPSKPPRRHGNGYFCYLSPLASLGD